MLSSGYADFLAGQIRIIVGHGHKGMGGRVVAQAGMTLDASGGIIRLASGKSPLSSSGPVAFRTQDSPKSGSLSVQTGTSSAGTTGVVHLSTGHASAEPGEIGLGGGTGDTGDGGRMRLGAGRTFAPDAKSGVMFVEAGDSGNGYGGAGGWVNIYAGLGAAYRGHVHLQAGRSQYAAGGVRQLTVTPLVDAAILYDVFNSIFHR
jgi:hypothetical protein